MQTNLGVIFWTGPETLEKQGQQFYSYNSLEEFAKKFADNVPKIRQTPNKNKILETS